MAQGGEPQQEQHRPRGTRYDFARRDELHVDQQRAKDGDRKRRVRCGDGGENLLTKLQGKP